ncbi:hypothetical protein B5D80_11225 [Micromonospora wenchangensis]|uniref:Uncharacterized protein n=1 Tax=Micromonospora wenchangensis TaxID=1185415 RepID=A0A246RQG1_9ACTN|nr:hypothetical protein B5D80_11225 [Micromonospora wenchangensis]
MAGPLESDVVQSARLDASPDDWAPDTCNHLDGPPGQWAGEHLQDRAVREEVVGEADEFGGVAAGAFASR